MAYFPDVPKIQYEGPKSKNQLAFKHYDPEQKVEGKKLKDLMRYTVCYWYTFRGTGCDPFGCSFVANGQFRALDEVKVVGTFLRQVISHMITLAISAILGASRKAMRSVRDCLALRAFAPLLSFGAGRITWLCSALAYDGRYLRQFVNRNSRHKSAGLMKFSLLIHSAGMVRVDGDVQQSAACTVWKASVPISPSTRTGSRRACPIISRLLIPMTGGSRC